MDEPETPGTEAAAPEPGEPDGRDDPDATAPDATAPGDGAGPAFERPVDKFRRTAAGTAIAAGMFGLRDALEGRPEREETVMEVPARGQVGDDDLDIVVDLAHPENFRIVVRRPPEPPHPS
jgi:hypothetical protein